jgi:hypothetical protein
MLKSYGVKNVRAWPILASLFTRDLNYHKVPFGVFGTWTPTKMSKTPPTLTVIVVEDSHYQAAFKLTLALTGYLPSEHVYTLSAVTVGWCSLSNLIQAPSVRNFVREWNLADCNKPSFRPISVPV